MRFFNTILEIVFPSKCALCGKSGSDLCLECLREASAAERESAKWIFPLYDYRCPAVKQSLWLLKYKGRKRLAEVFAEIIYEKIIEELSDLSVLENFLDPLLIPIPLSTERYRERGFNQAELLCRGIININNLRHGGDAKQALLSEMGVNFELATGILIKPKDTEHQARIKDRRARLKNLAGSFSVKNKKGKNIFIKGRNIILIDDVTTTGATLSEARKVLKDHGARKVIAFTVAH